MESGETGCGYLLRRCTKGFKLLSILFFQGVAKGAQIKRPIKYRPLPKVISKQVVEQMLVSIPNFKHKTALTLVYACGLRRSEILNLKLMDLDSKRKTLTVINGKGQKDRVLPLSDKLMDMIIRYYKMYRPKKYLSQIFGKNY